MNVIFQCQHPCSGHYIYFLDNGNYVTLSVLETFTRNLMSLYSKAKDHGFWEWNAHYGNILLHPTTNRYGQPPSYYLSEATGAYKGWLRDVVAE